MYNKYSGGGQYNDYSNELYTQEIYAGRNRSYFVIVKEDRKGEMYLTIKELKYNQDNTKEVHRTMIFQADLGNFLLGLQNAVEFIKKTDPEAISIRSKPDRDSGEYEGGSERRNYDDSKQSESYNGPTSPIAKFAKKTGSYNNYGDNQDRQRLQRIERPSIENDQFDPNTPEPKKTNSTQVIVDEVSTDKTTIISTKNYVAPVPTIIQPRKIVEEPTIVDGNLTQEIRTKLPEQAIVSLDDMDDLLEMN